MSRDPRWKHRLASIGGCAALMAAVVLLGAVPALAVTSYAGGADQVPQFVPNDHTPVAIHFTAQNLATSTAYYVKARFTRAASPDSATNRGWTWNGTSTVSRWAQERDDWIQFPQATSSSTGCITGNAGWVFAKFGDETTSGAYHVMISLSLDGLSGHTQNGTDDTMTTVMAPSQTFWIHNGAATAIQNAKRVEVDDQSASPNVGPFATLSKTETNTVDDNSDGIVDNEDWGPAGKRGDFWVGVPTGHDLNVYLAGGSVAWNSALVRSNTPGVDLAVNAADSQPPSAPATLTAHRSSGLVELSWTAATDNVGVTQYNVYRTVEATQIGGAANYTPAWSRIATTAGLSRDDVTAVDGVRYFYRVRAVDAATNGSAFSPVADTVAPVSRVTATPHSAHVLLSWTNPAGPDFAGVLIARSTTSFPAPPDPGSVVPNGAGSFVATTAGTSFDDIPLVNGQAYYYSVFAYDDGMNYSPARTAGPVTPARASTSMTLSRSASPIAYGGTVALSGRLTSSDGTVTSVPAAPLYRKATAAAAWSRDGSATYDPASGSFKASRRLYANAYFKIAFEGDTTYTASESPAVVVSVRVALGKPSVPRIIVHGRSFVVSGTLKPKSWGKTRLTFERWLRGKWRSYKTVWAKNSNPGGVSYTKYTAKASAAVAGRFRVRAYHADATHSPTYSSWRTFAAR
jgi:hypothetical protein